MSAWLERTYNGAAYLAGFFLAGILVCVVTGILGRLLNFDAAGVDAYAGYSMAASAFLALAHTLRRQEHIRVSLLLNSVAGPWRRRVELLCHAVGVAVSAALTWFSLRLVWQSYVFNDVSTGLDATPLWIPQIGMAAGAALLLVAFVHQLVELLVNPSPRHRQPADVVQAHIE